MRLHLDFETYAEVDLRKRGLVNYLADPAFEVTLTAMAIGDGRVMQWEGIPVLLFQALTKIPDLRWHAFHAPFERGALEVYGVEVPLELWRCTMSHAYCRSFSGTLAKVGEQVGLPADKQKLADGSRLINRFAKPAPKNHKADRYTKINDPTGWARFMEYNRVDVIAEREIWRILNRWPWTPEEQSLWGLDQGINARGVPVDVPMAEAAVTEADKWKQRYNEDCKAITGGVGASQVGKLLEWLQARGYPGADLAKENVDKVLTTR